MSSCEEPPQACLVDVVREADQSLHLPVVGRGGGQRLKLVPGDVELCEVGEVGLPALLIEEEPGRVERQYSTNGGAGRSDGKLFEQPASSRLDGVEHAGGVDVLGDHPFCDP